MLLTTVTDRAMVIKYIKLSSFNLSDIDIDKVKFYTREIKSDDIGIITNTDGKFVLYVSHYTRIDISKEDEKAMESDGIYIYDLRNKVLIYSTTSHREFTYLSPYPYASSEGCLAFYGDDIRFIRKDNYWNLLLSIVVIKRTRNLLKTVTPSFFGIRMVSKFLADVFNLQPDIPQTSPIHQMIKPARENSLDLEELRKDFYSDDTGIDTNLVKFLSAIVYGEKVTDGYFVIDDLGFFTGDRGMGIVRTKIFKMYMRKGVLVIVVEDLCGETPDNVLELFIETTGINFVEIIKK